MTRSDARTEVGALTTADADRVFEILSPFDHLVLAVSGGPDSMALLYLVAEWRERQPNARPLISVATVDHGLRRESAAEAEFVAAHSKKLKLPHTVLTWSGVKPATGISQAARDARYERLASYAGEVGGSARCAVVTAHHADDQAETFLMRLARGSGADGLAAMAPARALNDGSSLQLLRPLLSVPKARLLATLTAREVQAADDPTNSDDTYERPRLRKRMAAIEQAGLTADAIALSARRMREARDALDYATSAFAATLAFNCNHEVFASIDRAAFDAGPIYLRQRVLQRLITRFGGASRAPELAEIESIAQRIASEATLTATLGGTLVKADRGHVQIWREAGRLTVGDIALAPGGHLTWDARFQISLAEKAEATLTIRPLGAAGYRSLSELLIPAGIPPPAAEALPAFWRDRKLLAVPTLAPFAGQNARALDPGGVTVQAVRTSQIA